jgi:hypothetical protein
MPIGGLIVLLLAVFTKQVAIFAPAAVALFLWFRSRRTAIIWGATFVACALAVFAAMEAWSGGWFSFYTIKVPFSAGMELSKINLASTFFGAVWILLWGALAVAIPGEVRKSAGLGEASPGIALWTWTLGGALVFTFAQSLKWGAALNAFVPLVPALAVLGGVSLEALMRRFKEPGWGRIAVVAAALMQVAMISYRPTLPSDADRTAQRRIAQWVSAAPGDVFVSVFSSQLFLSAYGKKYFGDDVTIGDLVRAGQWRGGQLIEKIRSGGFSVMILRPNLEPRDFAAAVRESYVPAEQIRVPGALSHWGYMEVYVPRNAPWKPPEE